MNETENIQSGRFECIGWFITLMVGGGEPFFWNCGMSWFYAETTKTVSCGIGATDRRRDNRVWRNWCSLKFETQSVRGRTVRTWGSVELRVVTKVKRTKAVDTINTADRRFITWGWALRGVYAPCINSDTRWELRYSTPIPAVVSLNCHTCDVWALFIPLFVDKWFVEQKSRPQPKASAPETAVSRIISRRRKSNVLPHRAIEQNG